MYRKIFLCLVVSILAIIPFFWLKPGYVDIGGDSSRLYFYDPINYLKSFSLYTVSPNGFNTEGNGSYLIPFTLFLALLKFFFLSPYLITTLINSLTLVAAFLSVFGIITTFLNPYVHKNRDRINVYFSAVAAGVFYTFSPALISLGWWTVALSTHNQFFLNPLMFFLLLTYMVRKDFIYMLLFLIISFIFSPNFFLSPYFFSFYPVAIVFLLIYAIGIVHIRLNIKEIVIAFFLYLLIHSVHLFRYIYDLFQSSSGTYQLVFSEVGKIDRGLGYFLSEQVSTKILNNLLDLQHAIVGDIHLAWFLIPGIILIGLLLVDKASKAWQIRRTFSLLLIFFFITFYLITAKVTYGSLEFYKLLFNVPGFGMFRNYVGQFSHVYTFFYSLVFGISIFYIFASIRKLYIKLAFLVIIIVIFIISAIPFIRGDAINIVLNAGSKEEIKTPIRMDPQYEHDVLLPIRENKYDGKYFLFPMDDSGAQVLRGEDGGYIGPPTIAYLTGKSVYSGLGGLGKFYESFMSMAINKDYVGIDNMLMMLNVKYLFFNSDEKIYGDTFSGYPYSRARTVMPLTTSLYKDFLALLNVNKSKDLGSSGRYHLYEVNKANYRPHIYIAKKKYLYDEISSLIFFPLPFREIDNRIALLGTNSIQGQSVEKNDGLYFEAKRERSILDPNFKIQDALVIEDSVPPQVYSVLYPLLVLSAKIPDSNESSTIRAEFDKGVYASSKIIKNIEIHLQNASIDVVFLEKELEKYKKSVIIHVDLLRTKKTIFDPFMFVAKLNKIIISDQNKVFHLIEESNTLSEKEKKDLFNIIENVFADIKKYTNTSVGSPVHKVYTINPPESGIYSIYVEKQVVPDNGTGMSIVSGGKTFDTQSFKTDNYWIHTGQQEMKKGKSVTFDFTMLDNNDFSQKLLGMPLKDLPKASYAANLITKGQSLGAISNNIRNVLDWEAYTTYIISFEFKEKNTDDSWKKYRVLVETGDKAEVAHVLIMNTQYDSPQKIEDFYIKAEMDVRNLAIVNYSWPKIVLKKEEKKEEKLLPSVAFTKINPTKYLVHVSGAINPYTLVFSDVFNQNWKVFLRDGEKEKNDEVIASYYNGGVKENKHRNEFFNAQTFETWGKKPISEQRHTQVNVYANAWDITPGDVDGKTDYTLIIELTSQQTLYILLVTSLTGVAICLLWIKILFIQKGKRYYKGRTNYA